MNDLKLKDFSIGNDQSMTLMGGMNVLESRDLAMMVAEKFKSQEMAGHIQLQKGERSSLSYLASLIL